MGYLDRECQFCDPTFRPTGHTTAGEADSRSCPATRESLPLDIYHLRGGVVTVAEVARDVVRAFMGKEGNLLRE